MSCKRVHVHVLKEIYVFINSLFIYMFSHREEYYPELCESAKGEGSEMPKVSFCLLYTSDAADE